MINISMKSYTSIQCLGYLGDREGLPQPLWWLWMVVVPCGPLWYFCGGTTTDPQLDHRGLWSRYTRACLAIFLEKKNFIHPLILVNYELFQVII